jgi:hypothetical protein
MIWRDNMTEQFGMGGLTQFSINATPPIPAYVRKKTSVKKLKPLRASPYMWEGVIGNTSDELYGPSVRATFWPTFK